MGSKKIILVAIIIIFIIYLCVFKLGLGKTLFAFFQNLDKNTVNMSFINKINIIVVSSLSILCSFIGYFVARRKKRNRLFWTFVCLILNVWGLLLLVLFSRKDNRT